MYVVIQNFYVYSKNQRNNNWTQKNINPVSSINLVLSCLVLFDLVSIFEWKMYLCLLLELFLFSQTRNFTFVALIFQHGVCIFFFSNHFWRTNTLPSASDSIGPIVLSFFTKNWPNFPLIVQSWVCELLWCRISFVVELVMISTSSSPFCWERMSSMSLQLNHVAMSISWDENFMTVVHGYCCCCDGRSCPKK